MFYSLANRPSNEVGVCYQDGHGLVKELSQSITSSNLQTLFLIYVLRAEYKFTV